MCRRSRAIGSAGDRHADSSDALLAGSRCRGSLQDQHPRFGGAGRSMRPQGSWTDDVNMSPDPLILHLTGGELTINRPSRPRAKVQHPNHERAVAKSRLLSHLMQFGRLPDRRFRSGPEAIMGQRHKLSLAWPREWASTSIVSPRDHSLCHL